VVGQQRPLAESPNGDQTAADELAVPLVSKWKAVMPTSALPSDGVLHVHTEGQNQQQPVARNTPPSVPMSQQTVV